MHKLTKINKIKNKLYVLCGEGGCINVHDWHELKT